MKKQLLFVAMLLVSVLGFAQNFEALSLASSIPLPSEKMKSTDGKSYAISDVKGKNGTLVMFSCNTCPYVVRYEGRTRETIKFAKANGYGVIIINSNEAQRDDEDSFDAMVQYGKKQGYENTPYVVDVNSKVANAFGATRTPEVFLFDKNNKLVYHGAIDDNHIAAQAERKHAQVAMEELKNGKQITMKETRSVGCTIKRM